MHERSRGYEVEGEEIPYITPLPSVCGVPDASMDSAVSDVLRRDDNHKKFRKLPASRQQGVKKTQSTISSTFESNINLIG